MKFALNEILIYNKNFVFRKLEINTICYAYSNESPFKYYINILGGGDVQNLGKPAYIILACSLILGMTVMH